MKGKALTGELAGTFLLVFIGCGSLCAAAFGGANLASYQIALIWGAGVSLAIYLTAGTGGSHLNPAVTLALAVWDEFPLRQVLPRIMAQMTGAFLAAAALHFAYAGAITDFEKLHAITRGAAGSEASAMVFGEFYPPPGGQPLPEIAQRSVQPAQAFAVELGGTAVLLLVICTLSGRASAVIPGKVVPLLIGGTVSLLISLLGPLTMAGFNPARDFAPRLYSSVMGGWGEVPFSTNGWGWLTVYIVAPMLGGVLGAGIYHRLLKPAK